MNNGYGMNMFNNNSGNANNSDNNNNGKKKFNIPKFVPKLAIFIVIVLVIIIGKKVIEVRTYDYKPTVSASLQAFYLSTNPNDLTPITDLLDKYNKNDNVREGIQEYAYSIVGTWYKYLDGKFTCDRSNRNACQVQQEEFNQLNEKLKYLYGKKSTDGYAAISPSKYQSLKTEGEKKINALNSYITDVNSKDPKDSETIRKEKCARVNKDECDNCKDGICTCYYIDNNKKDGQEPIKCTGIPEKKR